MKVACEIVNFGLQHDSPPPPLRVSFQLCFSKVAHDFYPPPTVYSQKQGPYGWCVVVVHFSITPEQDRLLIVSYDKLE